MKFFKVISIIRTSIFFYFLLNSNLFGNLDSAKYYYNCGQSGTALKFLRLTPFEKLSFTEKVLWWKLKFDSDHETGRIESAKSDAVSLQMLRTSAGLENYYAAEFYAMMALCYHTQIRVDSACDFSLKAITLLRKTKSKADSLDIYRIYWAHAATTRNNINGMFREVHRREPKVEEALNFSKFYIPACFDTAVIFADKIKEGKKIVLARLYRSRANYYLDYFAKQSENRLKSVELCFYKKALVDYENAIRCLNNIRPLPLTYLGNIYSLRGLLEMFMQDYSSATVFFNQANKYLEVETIPDESSAKLYNQLVLCQFMSVAENRKFVLSRDTNHLHSAIAINEKATGWYIKFINATIGNGSPYRDVYSLNPIRKLVEYEAELFLTSGRKRNFERAYFFLNLNNEIAQNRLTPDSLNKISERLLRKSGTLYMEGSLDKVRRHLEKQDCMLIFWDTNTELGLKSTLAFVIEQNTCGLKKLTRSNSFAYSVFSTSRPAVFSQLKDSSEVSTEKYLKGVSAKYYEQIKQLISADVKNISVVPNRELSFLPFEVLTFEQGGSTHYLLERFAVNYLYVPSDFYAPSNATYSVKGLTIFNNTVSENGKTIYPFSNASANYLVKQYGGASVLRELNRAAFLQACKDEKSLVYVFSHASADPNNLNKSYILIGKDTLTVSDIIQRPMQSPLLCLMACETDYGDYDPNAGKLTMAPIFLQNGVKALITTQWLVDDKVCAMISEKFHENLVKGKTASEALRLAKLELLKQDKAYSSPLYWGAFRLIGQDIAINKLTVGTNKEKTVLLIVVLIFLFLLYKLLQIRKTRVKTG